MEKLNFQSPLESDEASYTKGDQSANNNLLEEQLKYLC